MKKLAIFGVLMILCVSLLTACDSSAEAFIGTWTGTETTEIDTLLGEENNMLEVDSQMTLVINSDKTFSLSGTLTDDAVTAIEELTRAYIQELMDAEKEANDLTDEDVLLVMENMLEMTVDEYAVYYADLVNESNTVTITGDWYIEDDVLYVSVDDELLDGFYLSEGLLYASNSDIVFTWA